MRFHEILLDLDGVCKDFYTAALAAHRRIDINIDNWPIPGASLPEVMGYDITKEGWQKDFWAPINMDPSFWQECPIFPWTHQLIEVLKEHTGPHGVVICTGPASGTAREKVEKLRWLARHEIHLEVRFEREKWKYSKPGVLLVDDWEKQVDKFVGDGNSGGMSLLFPRPWNRNYIHSAEPLKYVVDWLSRLRISQKDGEHRGSQIFPKL